MCGNANYCLYLDQIKSKMSSLNSHFCRDTSVKEKKLVTVFQRVTQPPLFRNTNPDYLICGSTPSCQTQRDWLKWARNNSYKRPAYFYRHNYLLFIIKLGFITTGVKMTTEKGKSCIRFYSVYIVDMSTASATFLIPTYIKRQQLSTHHIL